jgi:hypothetical protein
MNIFRYQGSSMWPCFQEGDLLEYEACHPAELRRGDCVVYTSRNGIATHRVMRNQVALTTRGDAFTENDCDPVETHQVIGKVTRRHRLGESENVAGGMQGMVAGLFYHYAGRIDPTRESRAGKLARCIRKLSMLLLRPLWRQGREQTLISLAGKSRIWVLGDKLIGWRCAESREWVVSWPLRVLVEIKP